MELPSDAPQPAAPDAQAPPEPGGAGRVRLFGAALCGLSAVSALDWAAPGSAQVAASRTAQALPILAAIVLPLAPLTIGLRRLARRAPRADLWLLLGVPVGLALGGLARPAAALDAVVFMIAAVVLVGYVIVAARATIDRAQPHVAAATRPRLSDVVPRRAQRRLRIYRAAPIAAALVFAVPLGAATVEVAGGGTPAPVFVFAVAGLLATFACRAIVVDAMERHLQRDPALKSALHRLQRHARRGRPGAPFYAAATLALVGMLLFASRHLLGFDSGSPP